MKKYNVIGINECNEEFYVDEIRVNEMEDFTCEELAYMILEKRMELYRERYNEEIQVGKFYIEPCFQTMSYRELCEYGEYMENEY